MFQLLISIVLNFLILKYVLENERDKCACALTWHHKYIKYFTPFIIFMSIVNLLFKKKINNLKNNKLVSLIFGIISLLSFAYLVILVIYFFHLYAKECKCSKDPKRIF